MATMIAGVWGCGVAACSGPEVCNNGVDDNGDGFEDCWDSRCVGSEPCTPPLMRSTVSLMETLCEDGTDDDGDGLMDCEDADCAGETGCEERCDDHTDNDGDGLTDCADDDCFGPACVGATAAWVESADLRLDHWRSAGTGSWVGAANTFGSNTTSVNQIRAVNVAGLVRVFDGYGGATTCSWELDRARAAHVTRFVNFRASSAYGRASSTSPAQGAALERRGLSLRAGCAANPDGFLPRVLVPGSGGADLAGFEPIMVRNTFSWTTPTYGSGSRQFDTTFREGLVPVAGWYVGRGDGRVRGQSNPSRTGTSTTTRTWPAGADPGAVYYTRP